MTNLDDNYSKHYAIQYSKLVENYQQKVIMDLEISRKFHKVIGKTLAKTTNFLE